MKPTNNLHAGALCILILYSFLYSCSLCSLSGLSDACYFLWNFQLAGYRIHKLSCCRQGSRQRNLMQWMSQISLYSTSEKGVLFPPNVFDEQGKLAATNS